MIPAIQKQKYFSLPLIYTIIIIALIGFGVEGQIDENAKVVMQILILTYCVSNFNVSIATFFILNFFFRNYFRYNFFGIPLLDAFGIISLVLFFRFFTKGITSQKSLFERKYLWLITLSFIGNFIVCFRYWIFQDFIFKTEVITLLTNFLLFPIAIIYLTNQIFKNAKSKEDFESFSLILVGIAIFSFFYLLEVFLSINVTHSFSGSLLWNNPLLGHKNTYGPFFVIIFFSILHFYNFENKNKIFFQFGLFASLSIITMSISRNAYAGLILVNGFLIWKGILVDKKFFIVLILGSIVFAIFAGDAIIASTETVLNPILQGDFEQFQNSSSGHFTDSAFAQVGRWLVENPLFGGFFDERNQVESGWTSLIKQQGLVGLFLYLSLLIYFHRFFHKRIYSKNLGIKKYALIGYTTIICVYVLNTTDNLIYTFSATPLVFWLTFVYLAVLWFEKNEKLLSDQNTELKTLQENK